MLSKYILNSNWLSLSSNYKFDNNVDLFNVDLTLTGNLNLTYTSYLSNLQDIANNNYSYLFLTKSKKINSIFNNKLPEIDTNKQVCLLANRMVGYLVSEDTRFLNILNNFFGLNDIISLSDDNFFEVDFVSSNEVIIVSAKNKILRYIAIDDITANHTIIEKNETEKLTEFELDKIKINYIFDSQAKNLVLYKVIQDKTFVFSVQNSNSIVLKELSLNDLNNDSLFMLLRLRDLPKLKNNLSWVSYKKNVNNDLLDVSSSTDIENNFIAHFEYENVKGATINSNFLTLKNQFNIKDNSIYDNFNFRTYRSLFTGGNREEGYENINVGYNSEHCSQIFKSDKTTWFHVPYNNSGYRPNLNEVSFFERGAIAGQAPIYSDKIFKKAANYATTSNMGTTIDNEESGVWLCSWLSGGRESAVWVDRFYNINSFTPYEALKYASNVNYTPEFTNKYNEGITDVPTKITLEPGAWYAYSRVGGKTATHIMSGLKDTLVANNFNSFKSSSKLEIPVSTDINGQNIYEFDGNNYGIISTEKLNYFNNFNISFFATRDDWNVNKEYQIFGNYLDSGFGMFNSNYINPLNFYIDNKVIYILNNKFDTILTVDVGFFLQDIDFEIYGVFRREFINNFHILTNKNQILEINANGTLVDLLSVQKTGSNNIVSTTNNLNYGVILYDDGSALMVNLFSNVYEDITNKLIQTKAGNKQHPSVIIDSFNYVYVVDGIIPILKRSNLYYKSLDKNTIEVYNINTETINTYISSNEPIYGYNFDKQQNTYVLLKDSILFYNTLGDFVSSIKISTNNLEITAYDLSFQNINDKQQFNLRFIDSDNKNYCYNFTDKTYKQINNTSNLTDKLSGNFYEYNFDFSNYNYIQSIISNTFPLPSYNFKIRLFNQFNYEDVRILNTNILGEYLNTGTHHFSINLNTLNGVYEFFIDGMLYNRQVFEPAKYSFSSLFNNSIIFGSIPFHGGLVYSDFYKSKDFNPNITDLIIEKFKFYKNTLNLDEIKLLYFEKFAPKDLIVDIKMGTRNYIDTITRTFKHKMQGSKSNLINLVINDSLINDPQIQKRYEMLILKKLQNTLPGYVKIHSIRWVNNKNSGEKMLQGNFNTRNTLTNNIE